MQGSRGERGGGAVHGAVSGGVGGWRHKGVVTGTRGGAVRRRQPTREEEEVKFLQLLCLQSLMWSSYCSDFRGLG